MTMYHVMVWASALAFYLLLLLILDISAIIQILNDVQLSNFALPVYQTGLSVGFQDKHWSCDLVLSGHGSENRPSGDSPFGWWRSHFNIYREIICGFRCWGQFLCKNWWSLPGLMSDGTRAGLPCVIKWGDIWLSCYNWVTSTIIWTSYVSQETWSHLKLPKEFYLWDLPQHFCLKRRK